MPWLPARPRRLPPRGQGAARGRVAWAPGRRRTVTSGWRRAMTLNFDNYDVDIDVEATRRAHSRLPRTSEKCGCAGCRNFTLAIGDALGEGGRRLFASAGVEDPAKATESCVDLPHGDGTFLYGAWYHLCGRIRRRFEAVPDATSAEWGEARERRVGERAHQLRGRAQNHREGGRLRGRRHRPDGAVSGGGPVGPGRAQPLPGRVGADFRPPPSVRAVASSSASTASPTRTGRGPSRSGAGAGSPADGII